MNDATSTNIKMKRDHLEQLLENEELIKLQAKFYRKFWQGLMAVGFTEEQAVRIVGGK